MAKDDLEYRVGRALDSIPFGWSHVWIIVVLALAGYTEAYDAALTGSLIVMAKQPLHLAEADITWLVVGPTAVLCASMLVGSFLSDRYSRKTILQIGVIISTLFTLALALAQTADQLILLRMFGGIGFGLALPSGYPIGAELLPAKHRRTFAALYEIVLALAVTTIPLIGYLAAHSPTGWKLLSLPGGLTLFVVPLLVHFVVPESPRWYLSHGNPSAAIATVNRMIARSGARVAAIPLSAAAGWSASAGVLPPYAALFRGSQLRGTIVATLCWLGALVSYVLFSSLLPKALLAQGYAVQVSFGLSTLLFLVTIPGKILNGWMMERFGRRLTIFLVLFASIFGLALMVGAHSVTGDVQHARCDRGVHRWRGDHADDGDLQLPFSPHLHDRAIPHQSARARLFPVGDAGPRGGRHHHSVLRRKPHRVADDLLRHHAGVRTDRRVCAAAAGTRDGGAVGDGDDAAGHRCTRCGAGRRRIGAGAARGVNESRTPWSCFRHAPHRAGQGDRGRIFELDDGQLAIATMHPSFPLRVPDEDAKAREYRALVKDLEAVRRLMETL